MANERKRKWIILGIKIEAASKDLANINLDTKYKTMNITTIDLFYFFLV